MSRREVGGDRATVVTFCNINELQGQQLRRTFKMKRKHFLSIVDTSDSVFIIPHMGLKQGSGLWSIFKETCCFNQKNDTTGH